MLEFTPRRDITDAPMGGAVGGGDLRAAFNDALPTLDWASSANRRIVVALLDLRDWQWGLDDAVALIDPAEAARVQRRHFSADRRALALTYALHRLLLAAVLGRSPRHVPLFRDAHGCPRLGEGALRTSLSHADQWVAIAASTCGPVGIDIEPTARAVEMPEIAESVCHRTEAAMFDGAAGPGYGAALLALWVRKEAVLKAAGVGLARGMSSFAAAAGALLPLVPGARETTWVRMLDAGPGMVAALAGPPGVAVDCVWLRPRGSTARGAGCGIARPELVARPVPVGGNSHPADVDGNVRNRAGFRIATAVGAARKRDRHEDVATGTPEWRTTAPVDRLDSSASLLEVPCAIRR